MEFQKKKLEKSLQESLDESKEKLVLKERPGGNSEEIPGKFLELSQDQSL